MNVNLGASSKGAGKSEWDRVGEAEGREMNTGEGEDADSRVSSGTMSVHEDVAKRVNNGGLDGGSEDEAACLDIDLIRAMLPVHKDGSDRIDSMGDVEGNKGRDACSDIDSGSWLTAVHEDASEVVGDRENGLGVIEMDSASDSGTTFVHEDVDKDDGSRGGEVGVFEIDEMGDPETLFLHEDTRDGAEGEVGVIGGMSSGSGSGWTFVAEGAGVC